MTLVIASQLGADIDAALRSHAASPTVIAVPDQAPWTVAEQADVLLARPGPSWRAGRTLARPAAWPGRLQWVQTGSAGVDAFPFWLLDDVPVTCGRGVAADEVANYVVAAISARTKPLEQIAARNVEQWRPTTLGSVVGATIAIVGLGAIGQAVARRVLAMGAEAAALRRGDGPSVPGITLFDTLEALVAAADHIVLSVPGIPATDRLIDAAILRHARPGAHLVNVARGSVVDQDALLAALDEGRMGFATLDVTTPEPLPEGHPLYTHERVLLTPHIASNHRAGQPLLVRKVIANLENFLSGQPLIDRIDPAKGY